MLSFTTGVKTLRTHWEKLDLDKWWAITEVAGRGQVLGYEPDTQEGVRQWWFGWMLEPGRPVTVRSPLASQHSCLWCLLSLLIPGRPLVLAWESPRGPGCWRMLVSYVSLELVLSLAPRPSPRPGVLPHREWGLPVRRTDGHSLLLPLSRAVPGTWPPTFTLLESWRVLQVSPLCFSTVIVFIKTGQWLSSLPLSLD